MNASNNATLMGRLTKDPEIRYTQGDNSKPVARYTLAVDRAKTNADGSRDADFINCVAFDRQAEFAERYLHKGTKILVNGEIHTGKFQKQDGTTQYTTDIIVNAHSFCESRQTAQQTAPQAQPNKLFILR